jgi:hypothetical protein
MFNTPADINRNLITSNVTVNDVIVTSGTAILSPENGIYNAPFPNTIRILKTNHNTSSYSFNFGNKLKIFPTLSGRYSIQFSVFNTELTPVDFDLIIYENGTPTTHSFTIGANLIWETFFKDFIANDGVDYDFSFVIKQGANTGHLLLIGGFQIQCAFNNDLNFDYKKGGNPTMWIDRTDLINTQNLTALTDNIVQITTATEGNGYGIEYINLLDANGKVTPINQNDVISVDFSCTIETPSGSDRFIDVKGLVDGVSYRQITHKLLKGSGNLDQLSVSWILPVKQAFKLNGLQIALNPNSNCTISNRYISVTRIHEAL